MTRHLRTGPFKRCMAAGRHLSAHRMAWAANQITSGIDWCGSNKGNIVAGLLKGRAGRTGHSVKAITYAFEIQENARGETSLSAENVERARTEAATWEARAVEASEAEARHRKAFGTTNYRHHNGAAHARRKAKHLRKAIASATGNGQA